MMVFGSFLGKKEISKLMLKHTAAKLQMTSIVGRLANGYGHVYLRLVGYPFNAVDRIRLKTIFAYARKKHGTLLDIGCSFGTLAFHFAYNGYNVTGIDINPESLNLAKKINKILKLENVFFLNSDFINNNFNSNEFDVVTSIEVLEHIEDDNRFIHEIYRILKVNGIVILSVPYSREANNYSSPCPSFINKEGKKVSIGTLGEFHYRMGYNDTTLTSLLHQSGFEVMACQKHSRLTYSKSIIAFPFCYFMELLFGRFSQNYDKITVVAVKKG